ncbi:MAG: protein translocase SEC61 complex subunit gamma [Nanoarchaeota archaeon]
MVWKTISDMKRVWKVTKKPSKKEYFQTLKIVAIGFLIIGFFGFLLWLLLEGLLIPYLFN